MDNSGDYISREEAEKRLYQRAEIANSAYIDQTPHQIMMLAQNVVHLIPAADVRPVVRAHFNDDWETGCSTCSACGDGFLWEDFNGVGDWHFCPNCGADMREES